ALAIGLREAAPASDHLALFGRGSLLVQDRGLCRAAGGEFQRRDLSVLGADGDVAEADRGAVDAGDAALCVTVMGVFDLGLVAADVDDLELDGPARILPRPLPVTD